MTEPDRLVSAVSALAKVGACSSPSFSPDGTRLAFVSNLTGVPQVWTVAAEGGWPELVTAFDDPVRAVSWSPAGDWLACLVAPGGGMNSQIVLVKPDGSDERRITPGGADNNWLGPWAHDGAALVLSSNRDGGGMDCYLVEIGSGDWRKIATNSGTGRITDLSRDGSYALLNRMVSRGDNNLVLLDLTSGQETLLTPHDGPGTFDQGRFSPTGNAVYLLSNRDRERLAFARLAIDRAGRPGPLELLAARDDAEAEFLEVSEDGAIAALTWNATGRSELAFVDLAAGAVAPGPALPAEVIERIAWSRDGRTLALAISGSTAPADIWLLDRGTGALRQLTHSPHPGVALDTLVQPELVRFAAHDGLPLTGWLYRPRGTAAPGPTVLAFHGGPEGQERPHFTSVYQALVARGIAVFAPNVRGSSGFGKTFVNLDNGALRFDAIRDIASCLDEMVRAGVAQPGRIGIMGGSYGGYMTMAGLTHYSERFAAGVNIFGVVNFETFFAQTEPWMAAISTIEYGDPVTQRDLLRDLSPINALDRVTAPTLVLHGANDTNVPVVEAEQVVDGLRERGVPVDYVLFPDEGHGFVKERNRITAEVATVRWFSRYLGAD